jgi:hypothetical protein
MTDEAPSLEPWLNTLREDVQPMSAETRERLAVRLAGVTAAVAAGLSAPAASSALHRSFWYSRAFTAMVALPVGALIGAAGHAYLTRGAAPALSAAPTAFAPPLTPAPVPAPPTLSATALDPSPATPSPAKPMVPTPSVKTEASAPSLERELSLLERARSALSEGQPQTALQLLREHHSLYPKSVLQQEREALAIRALLGAGRRSEAQRRAQTFIQAYPTSALRGSIERAVGTTIP